MDGVLADFTAGAFAMIPEDMRNGKTLEDVRHAKDYDIARVLGIPSSVFWKTVDVRGFWAGLRMYPHVPMMVHYLKEHCKNLVIVTAPSWSLHCMPEKRLWLRHQLQWKDSDVFYGSKKWLMSRDFTLLIDDSPKNCADFAAQDGWALEVPSSWNTDPKDLGEIVMNNIKELLN